MRVLAVLLTCVCFPLLAVGQTGQIDGRILEDGLGDPLPGVNVYVDGTALGDATGADGAFLIEDVPPGEQTVVARALGYETARQTVVVREGETTTVTIQLIERPIEISEIVVERVMLTGGRRGLDEIPGSAQYLSPRDLERFSYNDPNRVLRQVPGVNIQEEDGYGLRPNIGLRGTGVERSSKITVMEDGVLIAPAPYAAPSAYYFPMIGRMQGVEVRKGSSQIKYGPYTTGGALNLISTQIPSEFAGRAEVFAGRDEQRTVHAYVGDAYTYGGFLVETYQTRSEGFKNLDTGDNTGFDIKDYMAKVRLNTRPDARIYQALTFKIGQVEETSDETYLGLTDTDFERTPYRRYAGSQEDVMNTEQRQYQARHVIRPLAFLDVTTTLYRNEFARNWYKLDKVRATADGPRVGIADLLATPGEHADALAIVTGQTSPNDNALEVKANNREYYSTGVQSVVGLQFDTPGLEHDVEVGLRVHEDQIDRFQWVDLYRMENGVMELTESGTEGTESNRVETAQATAAFAQYRLGWGRITVTPGLRFESITIERENYGTSDPDRSGEDLEVRSNSVDVWIPGIGVDVKVTDALSTFGGVHKGFAPPGSKDGTEPEESVNYEAGLRYRVPGGRAQAVAFFNDYSNLLGADLAAAGGQGTTAQFNGGAVDVVGLELSADYDLGLLLDTDLSLPASFAYTFTSGDFQNAFESDFDAWGTVEAGDELPYLPEHQLHAGLGLSTGPYGVRLSARYVSDMRTVAGQGTIPDDRRIDSHVVLDLAADYQVTRRVTVFGSVRNLTDEVYAVARRPAGLRPGLPRALLLGLKASF
ncbi:MAG: TonB-dependent receptor [Bacteroidetes bacterium]|jgi:Fe(3+) dicitrate transport protein|nr:TonB-dependent receptor [Bacteroidota bacterium]